MNWQPIETAPKDGKPVLLNGVGIIAVGWWDPSHDALFPWFMVELDGFPQVMTGDDLRLYLESNLWAKDGPTHWMPLPAPPEAA